VVRLPVVILGVWLGVGAAVAEPEVVPPPAPGAAPAPAPAPAPAVSPTSLDEALGLSKPVPGVGAAAAGKGAVEPGREKLDALLKQEQPEDDEFKQALGLMRQSAGRLRDAGDTSLATQRVQQEAIDKLDQLIAKAKKQQQKQKSSSSSGSQGGQQKEQRQGASQPKQAEGSQGERRGQDRDSRENAEAPSKRDVSMRPALESARAAWGNLPERLRQSLLQGAGDTFSKEYQRLTEEYYKRLGEQAE